MHLSPAAAEGAAASCSRAMEKSSSCESLGAQPPAARPPSEDSLSRWGLRPGRAGGRRGEASGGWQRGRGRGRDGKGRVVRGRRGRGPEEVEAADSRCGDGEPERAVAPPQGPRCEGENAVSLWPLPFLSLLTFRSSRLLQLCLRTQRFYFNRRSVVKGLVFSLFCPPCH